MLKKSKSKVLTYVTHRIIRFELSTALCSMLCSKTSPPYVYRHLPRADRISSLCNAIDDDDE